MTTLPFKMENTLGWLAPALSLFFALAIQIPSSAGASSFATIDLPNGEPTSLQGINDKGDIVGFSQGATYAHGLLYTNGMFVPIDVPGSMDTSARGINFSRDIVGEYDVDGVTTHGFLREKNGYTTIDYPGAANTFPNAINASGDIVGFYNDTQHSHGFLRDKNGVFSAINYPGATNTFAYGINDQGDIVGAYSDTAGFSHGFLRTKQGVFSSINVPGASNSGARGINSNGDVVGEYLGGHSYLLSGGTFTTIDLPGATSTRARGINARGDISGNYDSAGAVHGFFRLNGRLLIVTTLDDHDDGDASRTDCTLREAINAANANTAEDETITFAAGLAGTIQLSSELPQIASNLKIVGPGAGVINVRRNSAENFHIFLVSNVTPGGSVTISGLTLSNGRAPSSAFPNACGGGILNAISNLTIDRCVITSNRDAGFPATGGGIFNYQGTLTITNSTISDNSGFSGGGIGNYRGTSGTATLTLVNCTLSGNSVTAGTGGAIQNNATVPGASATANLTSCTLSGNQAPSTFGGGGTGAAIQNVVSGGGSGTVNLTHCTLKNNVSAAGGEISNTSSGGPATVTLRNSVLNAGGSGPVLQNSGGTITSLGYNFASDAANGDGGTGPGGFLNATGDVRNTNPLLGLLSDNGGPTRTHLPLTGSPVLDRGKSFAIVFDQRGLARIADAAHFPNASGGDGADIGAAEVNPAGSLTDNDGDGMPDEWETFYGLTDPAADPDGDGQTNLQEYTNGTNPRDSASYALRIRSIIRPANRHILLQAIGAPNVTYLVQVSDNPGSNSFDNGCDRHATADAFGALQYDDAEALGLTRRFYRIVSETSINPCGP